MDFLRYFCLLQSDSAISTSQSSTGARPIFMTTPGISKKVTAEERRIEESRQRTKHWKRWGPYLSERAWGTVREDYSADGDAWNYFPRARVRTAGARMASAAFPISSSVSVSPSRFGMGETRF